MPVPGPCTGALALMKRTEPTPLANPDAQENEKRDEITSEDSRIVGAAVKLHKAIHWRPSSWVSAREQDDDSSFSEGPRLVRVSSGEWLSGRIPAPIGELYGAAQEQVDERAREATRRSQELARLRAMYGVHDAPDNDQNEEEPNRPLVPVNTPSTPRQSFRNDSAVGLRQSLIEEHFYFVWPENQLPAVYKRTSATNPGPLLKSLSTRKQVGIGLETCPTAEETMDREVSAEGIVKMDPSKNHLSSDHELTHQLPVAPVSSQQTGSVPMPTDDAKWVLKQSGIFRRDKALPMPSKRVRFGGELDNEEGPSKDGGPLLKEHTAENLREQQGVEEEYDDDDLYADPPLVKPSSGPKATNGEPRIENPKCPVSLPQRDNKEEDGLQDFGPPPPIPPKSPLRSVRTVQQQETKLEYSGLPPPIPRKSPLRAVRAVLAAVSQASESDQRAALSIASKVAQLDEKQVCIESGKMAVSVSQTPRVTPSRLNPRAPSFRASKPTDHNPQSAQAPATGQNPVYPPPSIMYYTPPVHAGAFSNTQYEKGFEDGYKQSFIRGYSAGLKEPFRGGDNAVDRQSHDTWYHFGYEDGYRKGYGEGYEDGCVRMREESARI